MAIKVRGIPDEIAYAMVAANNQRMLDNISTSFHLDRTATTGGTYINPTVTRLTVTAATASDLATSVALVNDIKTVLNRHFADSVAHNTAVSAVVATATATDLATGITLANAMKTAYGTHLAAAGVHYTNDATNTIAAANASDQASLNTLLNEFKTDLNAHMLSAPVGMYVDVTGA